MDRWNIAALDRMSFRFKALMGFSLIVALISVLWLALWPVRSQRAIARITAQRQPSAEEALNKARTEAATLKAKKKWESFKADLGTTIGDFIKKHQLEHLEPLLFCEPASHVRGLTLCININRNEIIELFLHPDDPQYRRDSITASPDDLLPAKVGGLVYFVEDHAFQTGYVPLVAGISWRTGGAYEYSGTGDHYEKSQEHARSISLDR